MVKITFSFVPFCSHFLPYSIFEIMRAQMHRQANQTRPHEASQWSQSLTEVLDGRLHYLNRSFEHNLLIQEIYLDVIKNKKTIHAKELKEYYRLFTNSKAEALMFEHIHHQHDPIDLANSNKEMIYALKRLYCRLIEKIMVKISYYLMNKPAFNFAYSHANEMIKKCEILMRRLNNFKDLTTMDEIIEKIFQENQEFQEHIFHQLIYKGYINSVDEFYRINGIDVEHRDVYERNKDTEDENESQEDVLVEKNIKFRAKYQSNLNKDVPASSLRKQVRPMNDLKQHMAMSNRTGMIELQGKYKDLIISLDKIISQETFEQIAEVKQSDQNQKDEEQVAESNFIDITSTSSQPAQLIETKTQEPSPASGIRKTSQSKTTKLRKQTSPKKTSEIIGQQFQTRSQLHKKEITIQSLNSSSAIPDSSREKLRDSLRKQTTPLFSKSFINAIKSIEKSNLMEQTTRLSVKRMSQHIIEFHKQNDKESSISQKSSKEKMSLMHALKKSNQKKSIIKLLNIYKNRTLDTYIGEAKKELTQTQQKYAEKDRKKDSTRERKSNFAQQQQQQVQYQSGPAYEVLSKLKDDPSIKRRILRNTTKASIFKQQSSKRLKHLQHLKSRLKQNIQQPKTENLLKNFQHLQSKLKTPAKSSIFQNFRLSQKLSVNNIYRVAQRHDSSLRNSREKVGLHSTLILTSKGIQSIDPTTMVKERMERRSERMRQKLSRTVDITPTQTPLFPHFEVYDRVRRLIVK